MKQAWSSNVDLEVNNMDTTGNKNNLTAAFFFNRNAAYFSAPWNVLSIQ